MERADSVGKVRRTGRQAGMQQYGQANRPAREQHGLGVKLVCRPRLNQIQYLIVNKQLTASRRGLLPAACRKNSSSPSFASGLIWVLGACSSAARPPTKPLAASAAAAVGEAAARLVQKEAAAWCGGSRGVSEAGQ
jgi:hypothetical protein